MMAAIVPLVLGLVLPRVLLLPLTVLSGVIFVASLVLFARQSRGQRTGGP